MRIVQFKDATGFKCVGSDCIDSCCTGWSVQFDKNTCDKVFQSEKFKDIAGEYINLNDHVMDEKIDYCDVMLRDDMRCPFLADSDLCSIQLELGEEGLSNMCALYPR